MFTKSKKKTMIVALAALVGVAACDDAPTSPDVGPNDAVVEGRVDETSPEPNSANGPQRAPGTAAQTVSIVQIDASGSYTELASADVAADGTFRVEGVPTGRSNVAAVAYVDGRVAGEVLIHGRIRSGAVVRAAPITYESTMETRAYARLVASGRTSSISTSEMSLLVRADGPEVQTAVASQTEVNAVADGAAQAGATLGAVFSSAGVALDAAARAEALASAAMEFSADLDAGMSVEAAHRAYAEAALQAFAQAGAQLETVVVATASAASTFDAQLEGRSSMRGRVMVQPVLFNLQARERLAARHTVSAEAVLALAVQAALDDADARVRAATTVSELRAAIETNVSSAVDIAVDAAVELLAAGASATVRADVRTAAETAMATATLRTRLEGAATASAAASAVANYRASVRSAVQAMIDASGGATADVDVVTSLFIAACGGAYIR